MTQRPTWPERIRQLIATTPPVHIQGDTAAATQPPSNGGIGMRLKALDASPRRPASMSAGW